jgi:hypothetical protein
MENQPGKDEKTEQRCVKDSHASGEITRPMFWTLLAQRPVLGQPDSLTKGLIAEFLQLRFARLPQARLHVASINAKIHLSSLYELVEGAGNRKTNRIADFSVMYGDAINFAAIRSCHVIYHCRQTVCRLARPVDHPNRPAQTACHRVIRVCKRRLPHDRNLASWAGA